MKKEYFPHAITMLIFMIFITPTAKSGNAAPNIKEETISFTADGRTYTAFLAYDANIQGRRPAILVIPEWWGLNDYPKMRVHRLAELGYIAMAADVFGNGRIAANPSEAQLLTAPFYKDPSMEKSRLDAAMTILKAYPQADPDNVAVIGYCFGGFVALNYAKMGADLKGVVSFHGGMGGVPVTKNLLKAKILICQGAIDKIAPVAQTEKFKHQLDSVGAVSTLKIYPNATHSFTNQASTEIGKKFNLPFSYNPEADKASWNDMKIFFDGIFKK